MTVTFKHLVLFWFYMKQISLLEYHNNIKEDKRRGYKMNYTIAPQDTLDSIATRFGVTPAEIMMYNNLTSDSRLIPGMVIVIPPAPTNFPEEPVPRQTFVYTVKQGETLPEIASRFGLSVRDIMFINRLNIPFVFPGQRLIIPFGLMPVSEMFLVSD